MSPEKKIRHVPGLPESEGAVSAEGARGLAPAGGAQGLAHGGAPRATGEAAFPEMPRQLLKAEKLSIGWGGKKSGFVLAHDINLSVAPQTLVCLVGPNGSGKSTLLRTLTGLQARMAGRLWLDGRELAEWSAEERARKAACVSSEKMESGYFTVFDIVAFGRYPYTDSRNTLSPEDRAHVDKAIASVGMADFSRRRFSDLSDGEKQKVQIARAIAQDTPLLVLDEPTAFLDAPSRIEVFHLAGSLAHESGKAVIVCTHEVDLALRCADAVWVMDRAHRFSSGSPALVAFSGAIGRAFDTGEVRYDISAGAFKVRKKSERG